jgi:hypothetical protein
VEFGDLKTNFGELTFRNCPKSLETTCRAALETVEERCFGLLIPTKCTIVALLVPLFGQFLHALG